jgi:hypothetical protein
MRDGVLVVTRGENHSTNCLLAYVGSQNANP